MKINIHASSDRLLPLLPANISVVHVPYDGTPFSEHYIIDNTIYAYCGVGGVYLDIAIEMILTEIKNNKVQKWEVQEYISDNYHRIVSQGACICDVYNSGNDTDFKRNTKLIVKAPEMYELLCLILDNNNHTNLVKRVNRIISSIQQ